MNLDRAAFFLPHAQFSAMVPEKRTNKAAHSLAANDTAFSRKRGGFFVAGWGVCYTQPRILPKASPLDSKERSALRFSRSQKGRKGMVKKRGRNGKNWKAIKKVPCEAATARLASHGFSILNIARHFLKDQEKEKWRCGTDKIKRNKRGVSDCPRCGGARSESLAPPYAAYREMVKRRFPKQMDESRLKRPLLCTCAVPDTRRRR